MNNILKKFESEILNFDIANLQISSFNNILLIGQNSVFTLKNTSDNLEYELREYCISNDFESDALEIKKIICLNELHTDIDNIKNTQLKRSINIDSIITNLESDYSYLSDLRTLIHNGNLVFALDGFTIPEGLQKINTGSISFVVPQKKLYLKNIHEVDKYIAKYSTNFNVLSNELNLVDLVLDNVEIINEGSFNDINYIRHIIIKNNCSFTEIPKNSFSKIINCTDISVDNNISCISIGAFSNNYSLSSIQLPKSLIHIAERAFENDCSLTSIDIPINVKDIGRDCFKNCTHIKEIFIKNTTNVIKLNFDFNNLPYDVKIFVHEDIYNQYLSSDEVISSVNNKYYFYCYK